MERFFKIDRYNTFLDWDLILTRKDVSLPEPKINTVELEGMDGSLDLTEALTGYVTYKDRIISASFWTDHGTRQDREALLRKIRQALHGRKVKIVEPDDPDHYFNGRVKITSEENNLAYMEISIECICDPYRYTINDIVNTSIVSTVPIDLVINNGGSKTITPTITANGSVTLIFGDVEISLTTGDYTVVDIRLEPGPNVITIFGSGSVTFTHKEADL